MIPTVLATWHITGDEPHYLLAAQSLVVDGDLNLKNNYQDRQYTAFYDAAYLDPHIKVVSESTWLPTHDVGFPLLIAPAYALGGRKGVMVWMAFMGALMATQLFLLGWEVSGTKWAGGAAWLGLAFSAPLSLYVLQIYPELAGSLVVTYASRHILGTSEWLGGNTGRPYWTWLRVLATALALTLLPWLSGRYLPILVWLVVLLVWRQRTTRRVWLICGGLAFASVLAYLGTNFALYGGPAPAAASTGNAVSTGFADVAIPQIWRGLAAWLFDQQRGLFVYGPILIIAVVALPHLWRIRKFDGLFLFGPVVITWVLTSIWGGFYIGWEMSARYMIVGLPLLGGALAAAVRIRNVLFWALAALLLCISVVNTILVVRNPSYAFHESPVLFYERRTGFPIRQTLPALGTRAAIYPESGALAWEVAPGKAQYLTRVTMSELAIGWYVVRGQVELDYENGHQERPALQLGIYSSESGQELARQVFSGSSPRTLININAPFYNPYYDKWNYPLYVDVESTGAARVRLSYLLLEPDAWPTYGRVLVWGMLICAVTILFADK
jgi:hypothetical protein